MSQATPVLVDLAEYYVYVCFSHMDRKKSIVMDMSHAQASPPHNINETALPS